MDYTNWDESIYQDLVEPQATKKPLYLKFKMGSDLVSHGVLAVHKVYCMQNQSKKSNSLQGVFKNCVKGIFDMSVYRNSLDK